MGLFSKNSGSTTLPASMDGLSEEARKLALDKMKSGAGTDATDLIAPPPAALGGGAGSGSSSLFSGRKSSEKPAATATAVKTTNAELTERDRYLQQLKVRIHQQLVERLDVQNLRALPPETVRSEVRVLIRDLCQNEKGLLNLSEQERLMDEVMDETFGLGPLETLLKDAAISDILVNRYDRIYRERRGRLELSDVRFRDNSHLRQIIDRIVGL